MLTELHIRNFAIIDNISLEFHPGTTIISGETGSGKSILIDALEIALGQRTSSQVVRQGNERAEISVTFDITQLPAVQSWLEEKGFAPQDDCIIRRVITTQNKSKCFVNDSPTTLQSLRELVKCLINIHGQHEYQLLMNNQMQRRILDHFAGCQDLSKQLQKIFQEYQTQTQALETIYRQEKTRQDRLDFLQYQLDEYTSLNILENEYETLDHTQKQLANSETITHTIQMIIDTFQSDQNNPLEAIHSAQSSLRGIANLIPNLMEAKQLFEDARVSLEEALVSCRLSLDSCEHQPEALQEVEARLSTLLSLARKHQINPKDVYDHQQNLQSEFDSLQQAAHQAEDIQTQLGKLSEAYHETATQLSQKRKVAAKKLNEAITHEIQQLGMPKGRFEITLTPLSDAERTAFGYEHVSFTVSANPGQPLQALQKVASGGELSRISLAILLITAQHIPTPTLVLDEVDVGIGGETAKIVGQCIRRLGENNQVICITHLPQVAAKGHHHLAVSKSFTHDATFSAVEYLKPPQREAEIARMLGGNSKTSNAHAKELLES